MAWTSPGCDPPWVHNSEFEERLTEPVPKARARSIRKQINSGGVCFRDNVEITGSNPVRSASSDLPKRLKFN